MKSIKFYMVASLMMLSTSAFAQFANTGNNGSNSAATTVDTNGYSRLEVSYNPITVDFDGEGEDLTGFSVGYIKGFSISKKLPLFIEAGLRLQYATWSEDEDYSESGYTATSENKLTYIGANIPVSLSYKYNVNENVSIAPYIGVNFRYNIKAENKYSYEFSGYGDSESGEEKINYFDEDDMGEDGTWNRFQFGWNIGVGVNYKAFYAGLRYGGDFSEIAEEVKTSNWAVTVGYNF